MKTSATITAGQVVIAKADKVLSIGLETYTVRQGDRLEVIANNGGLLSVRPAGVSELALSVTIGTRPLGMFANEVTPEQPAPSPAPTDSHTYTSPEGYVYRITRKEPMQTAPGASYYSPYVDLRRTRPGCAEELLKICIGQADAERFGFTAAQFASLVGKPTEAPADELRRRQVDADEAQARNVRPMGAAPAPTTQAERDRAEVQEAAETFLAANPYTQIATRDLMKIRDALDFLQGNPNNPRAHRAAFDALRLVPSLPYLTR